MSTNVFILIAFIIGTLFGAVIILIVGSTKEDINKSEDEMDSTFDEADIYHQPKYYPRLEKEQNQ